MNPINIKYVFNLLGFLVYILAFSMVLAFLWALYDSSQLQINEVLKAFLYSIIISILFASCLKYYGKNSEPFLGRRESLLLVSATWFIGAGISALPYWFWAFINSPGTLEFNSYINCYFEAMSGLTTTGSTILSNIELIPNALLLWRSLTHWLGGLGIVVIYVALLPEMSGSKKQLFQVESSGIDHEGSSLSVGEKARTLIFIYLILSFAQFILMYISDSEISFFDTLIHTFSTISSGGFSNYNSSAGALSYSTQVIIAIFMLLAGVNFSIYHSILLGKIKESIKNSELQLYFIITIIAFLSILASILGTKYHTTSGQFSSDSIHIKIIDAFFQTTSLQTGTGFASVNYDQWPTFPKSIIIVLMLIGGCGGSTCGGIKVIRLLSMLKSVSLEIEKSFRPSIIQPIRVAGKSLSDRQNLAILNYIVCFLSLLGISSLLIVILEPKISGITAFTASLSSLSNVGPGLDDVGAIANYAWLSNQTKIVLSILMALGRLEIFAVAVLFLPKFWKGK